MSVGTLEAPKNAVLSTRHLVLLESLTLTQASLIKEALEANLDPVKNPLFSKSTAQKELFDEGMDIKPASTAWYHPMMEGESRSLYGSGGAPTNSLLNTEQERHVFLRYNFARMKAKDAVKAFRTSPTKTSAKAIIAWYNRVRDTREILAQANLALVLAMAKRTRMTEVDFGELVSEGNMALLRAIEKFDIARGFKFSTYACRAILKAFSRIAVKTSRYRQSFPTEFDPTMEKSDFLETKRADVEQDAIEELQRIVAENRADLSEVEKTVIQARFNLNNVRTTQYQQDQTLTLEEVGKIIGVTKERVRQIQNKALEKLRAVLEEEVLVK